MKIAKLSKLIILFLISFSIPVAGLCDSSIDIDNQCLEEADLYYDICIETGVSHYLCFEESVQFYDNCTAPPPPYSLDQYGVVKTLPLQRR